MGLDFRALVDSDADMPSWSYSGFMDFRVRVASSVGIELRSMEGFSADGEGCPWSAVETDMKALLQHSDCEGEMTAEECAKVEPELRRVIESWLEPPEVDYDKRTGLRLCDAMKLVAESGQPAKLIFT